MNAKQIFVIAIITMFLIVPFASAKQESVDVVKDTKQDKKIDDIAVDKTKETAKEIKNKDKDITGKITVTDSDTSNYEVSKDGDVAIKIKKNEAKGEHTKAKVSIPKEELQKIDEDGDKLYGVLHVADDGTTTHDVVTESELTAGIEMAFSENIVNGFSGYQEYTFSGVTSGQTLNIADVSGNYYTTYSVDGQIPISTGISEYSKNTYPNSSNMISCMPMTNSTEVVSGSSKTGYNVTYLNGEAIINASKPASYIAIGNLVYSGNLTISTWITSLSDTTSQHTFMWDLNSPTSGFSIGILNNKFINFVKGTSTYLYSSAGTAQRGVKTHVAYTISNINATHVRLVSYINGVQDTTAISTTQLVDGGTITAYVGNDKYFGGSSLNIDAYQIYSKSLPVADIRTLMTGYTGISVRPHPSYNYTPYTDSGTEKIIDTDATCQYLRYTDTTGGVHTVTVRVYFTEDITKTTETKGAVYQNTSIIHTKQNATASVGTIAYELDPLYSGTPVLSSNNTNATVSRNDTHAIISTGLVKQGDSFSYNVSVPDNHNHIIFLNRVMQWMGTGWDYVGVAPEDWTDAITDIEVTVS